MKIRLSAVLFVFLLTAQFAATQPASAQEATPQQPPAQPTAAQPATVPDLSGMTIPQAAAAVNLVGMALGREIHAIRPAESQAPVDTISGQSVPAGTPATPGAAVDVTILHDANVTLVYDDNDLTLINRAASRINLDNLAFHGVQGENQAAFHAGRWSGRVGPGNCMQIWSVNRGSGKGVDGCDTLERWMTTNNRAEHFWTTTGGVQAFNVVQDGLERAICEAAPPGSEAQPKRCELYLEPAGSSSDDNAGFVYFAYTTNSFLILNRTPDKWMRLNRSLLHVTEPSTGVGTFAIDLGDGATFGNPEIVAKIQRLAPGQCLLYTRAGTTDLTPPQPCHVIAHRQFLEKVFWDYNFELESVEDGKRRMCTAAVPNKLTLCILPR